VYCGVELYIEVIIRRYEAATAQPLSSLTRVNPSQHWPPAGVATKAAPSLKKKWVRFVIFDEADLILVCGGERRPATVRIDELDSRGFRMHGEAFSTR
jgi:hypothetical protein